MGIVGTRRYLLVGGILPILAMLVTLPAVGLGRGETATSRKPQTLFTIGKEDMSRMEFKGSGFAGIEVYDCDVANLDVAKFPLRIYKSSARQKWDDTGVARVMIRFRLAQDYSHAVLHLARWGAETDVVTVDKRRPIEVQALMIGSDEDVHGAGNIELGALKHGRHTIELSVAEDGAANSGRHSWDSISLTVW